MRYGLAVVLRVLAQPPRDRRHRGAGRREWAMQFRGPNGTGVSTADRPAGRVRASDGRGLEDAAAAGPLVAGADRHADLRHRPHGGEGELHALGHRAGPADREDPLAARRAAPAEGPPAERQRPRVAEPGHRRDRASTRSSRTSACWPSRPTASSGGACPSGPFSIFYGFGASPILVDDARHPAGRSGRRLLPHRRRQADRQGAVEGRSARRHLGLLDAHGVRAGRRPEAGRSSPSRSSSRPTRSPTARACGGCAACRAR